MASSNEDDLALTLALRSSAPAQRMNTVRTFRERLVEKSFSGTTQALLSSLFATYPLYQDAASRREVRACLKELFEWDPSRFPDFVRLLRVESSKAGLAPSNALVLIEWFALATRACTEQWETRQALWSDLLSADALLLDLLHATSQRKSLRSSADRVTKKALQEAFATLNFGPEVAKLAVAQLTDKNSLGYRAAGLLGLIADLHSEPSRLRAAGSSGYSSTSSIAGKFKSSFISFWIREVFGSKSLVPHHVVIAFRPFFSSVVTLEDVQNELAPALEKSILRAPEVALSGPARELFASLRSNFDPSENDLSGVLVHRLLKPLLGNLKSTNGTLRQGSVSVLEQLLPSCRNDTEMRRVIDELAGPLAGGKLSSADQKISFYRALGCIVPSKACSAAINNSISGAVSKEPNEAVVTAEVQVLTTHATYLIQQSEGDLVAILSPFLKGLGDKKPALQKIWAVCIGNMDWELRGSARTSASSVRLLEAVLPKLTEVFNEVNANLIQAAQNGLIVAAFVLLGLSRGLDTCDSSTVKSLFHRSKVVNSAVESDSKSFLLNPKYYAKLTNGDDLRWLIRALDSSCESVIALGEGSRSPIAWTQALLYASALKTASFTIRRVAEQTLADCYRRQPSGVSHMVNPGLWAWFRNWTTSLKDSAAVAAQTDMQGVIWAIQSICQTLGRNENAPDDVDRDTQNQLIEMLVLCQPAILPGISWISVCLRMGQDPGKLAMARTSDCIAQVNRILESDHDEAHSLEVVQAAAYNTFAELAFVAPEAVAPELVNQISMQLAVAQIYEFGPTDYAIARTPEGTAFVDVLASKSSEQGIPKGAHDSDILKWEAEVRAQVAAKKGSTKKLTAEEKAKVDAQLAKEAGIRQKLLRAKGNLLRGIGTIHALATGPPTEASLWIGSSLKCLLDLAKANSGLLVEGAVDKTYLACSNLVSPRLGLLRPFIGTAVLRALGSSHVPEAMSEEPLGRLVTRLLYRLRLGSEARPFDTVSLLYILPLVTLVLEQSGVGVKQGDSADEQITLALEFLSLHAGNFSDQHLPRAEVLQTLTQSMQSYTQQYKLIKECLSETTRAIADAPNEQEIKVLFGGTIVPQVSVRAASLQAIRDFLDLTDLDFAEEIWLACHDEEDENVTIADAVWQENALDATSQDSLKLLPYLESGDVALRRAAARSVAACTSNDSQVLKKVLQSLQERYCDLAKPRTPERDAYGMIKKTDLRDPWEGRHGIALAFKELANQWTSSELVPFSDFLISRGALSDRSNTVRDAMIDSASSIISKHGNEKIEELMQMFETALAASAKDEGYSDEINEAVAILYGALARHLPKGDKRTFDVLQRLLEALSTPSESVQYAVANCLPALIRKVPEKTSEYIQQTVDKALNAKQYASRRGAAYGLAGIVNGHGISSLREYRVMSTLRSAIENKKDANQRQGALFVYELFSLILGRTFEPYVTQIVPQLIATFGDSNADVRETCLDASKTCFSNLSSYGVKVILPILLEGLDETQWRSKKGACDLLGAMAYPDPQQLALSLPDIIPPLTGVLNDSHKEVRTSANRSLQRFGEVISNPEVKAHVSVVLKALSDPTKHTDEALDALIKVSFVHYLDAPSLALVVRILERGLGDRSGTKRKAAQIIGSLAHLTERKDLVSYLPILVEGLRAAVVDPVPATRATSSKALGSLIEKLGEDALPDLIPSLITSLKSDAGAGDRLGSAQALSEVLAGLGTSRLEEALPAILQNASSNRPSVREAFMSLLIFLPACFGNSFAAYLSRIIPPILSGLADELESIRDTALRAGRLLVKNFATKSIDLLLPELDRGLADDNYRIRLSSVELVGDLLFSLTGVTVKEDGEADEDRAKETGQSLLEVLGEEKRNKVLSSLYICRCDTSGLVRTAAINVWKALVASPRTLKELIPTLSQILIKRLASSNPEQKLIAGNALGELIRKAGEGILSTLLPTLEEELQTSTNADNKQGICIALREVISAASPEALVDYEEVLISVVRTALVDSDEEVRDTAAEAFDSMQQVLGRKAVDRVLPHLLSLLRTEDEADQALSALLTLLTDNTRANVILPNLIPTLLTSPMTSFNARAVASLSKVASSSISRRLGTILNALMDGIVTIKDVELRHELEGSFDTVLVSADEFDGLNNIMATMLALVKHDDHRRRAEAATRLGAFFNAAEVDFSRYYPDLVRVLLLSFDDRDPNVVKAACTALIDLMKRTRKEEMESLVVPTRQVVQQVGVAGHDLPGFCLPKGINSVLPIFLQGLMNGSAEQRTQAALALSDVIDRTSGDALKPFVTNITGPLIRFVSEKSPDLKCAILLTLNNLLDKIPMAVKPFMPQLQRTFAKSLADPSSDLLRSRAAKALGTLLNLKPRIDPLIAELVTGTKTPDSGVRNAMFKALYEVVSKAGESMSESSRNAILGLIDSDLGGADDAMAITSARLFGALVKVIPASEAHGLIKHRALASRTTQSSVLNLNSVLVEAPALLLDSFGEDVVALISRSITVKQQTFLADNFVLAGGKLLLHQSDAPPTTDLTSIVEALAAVVGPGNAADTRRLALVVIRTAARRAPALLRPHRAALVPPVFASVRDPVIPIKLAAEAAFVGLFEVGDVGSAAFDEYLAGPAGATLAAPAKKSMQDYFRRVALRLAAQAAERRAAEGGQGGLGLSSDEVEDEREIWSVGRVELGDVFSQDD